MKMVIYTAYPTAIITQILTASRIVLQEKAYRLFLIPLALIFIAFFVAIPTIAIPSNTLVYELSLYSVRDYVTLPILSLLASLFILMNVYAYVKINATKERYGVVAQAGAGGLVGTLASIFGAASCPMCVVAVFGFLGFEAVGFLIQYQWWVFLIALALLLFSLYCVSRKVNGACDSCG